MMTNYVYREILEMDGELEEKFYQILKETNQAQDDHVVEGINGHVDREFYLCINHEVRNALNAIMGFAQILGLEDFTQEEMKSYTKIICEESEHLLELFNRLFRLIEDIR
jgi:nitrogen-specific signal transduction histidine kinase